MDKKDEKKVGFAIGLLVLLTILIGVAINGLYNESDILRKCNEHYINEMIARNCIMPYESNSMYGLVKLPNGSIGWRAVEYNLSEYLG